MAKFKKSNFRQPDESNVDFLRRKKNYIARLRSNGLTVDQILNNLNPANPIPKDDDGNALVKKITKRTFERYMAKPEFCDMWQDANKELAIAVESRFYDILLKGNKKTETIYSKSYRSKDPNEMIITGKKETVQDVNPSLLMFALKNLNPDKWSDTQDVNVKGTQDIIIIDNIPDFDDEE